MAWLLAGVFGLALRHKLNAWPRFLASFQAYDLLPHRWVKVVAPVIVLAELVALAGLLLGPFVGVAIMQLGFASALSLLVVYFTGMLINVLRGRSYIDCGCGDDPTPLGLGVLARNALLIGLALGGIFGQGIEPSFLTFLVSAGFALLGLGLYLGYEQLLANRATHQRLWLGM